MVKFLCSDVEPIDEYQMRALRLGRKRFAEEYTGFWLLKRPIADPPTTPADADDDAINYETISVGAGDLEVSKDSTMDMSALDWVWRVMRVQKREGNPFPERISVGRARNCDVVLRLPFVSKLHAHLFQGEDGSLTLVDQRSANGTQVNGRELLPGDKAPVAVGDLISFGSLELELCDGGLLYDILMTEARRR